MVITIVVEGSAPPLSEGDSYDYGRGFIVRILGGLQRETVMTMIRIS
jgi:hypothetical protein